MAASRSREFFPGDQDYVEKENTKAKNTKRAMKVIVNVLREYCESKEMPQDFRVCMSRRHRLLGRFYLKLRNPKGESYKKTTTMSYRHGIQRHLQTTKPDIDIIHGAEFRESCKVFKGGHNGAQTPGTWWRCTPAVHQ